MNRSNFLVVGNCVVDQVWELEYFPQQDEEVLALGKSRVLGGNACNTSQVLAMLDNDVELVSSLAQDSDAHWILQELSERAVTTRYCQQKAGYSTPQSSIWLSRSNGSRTIVHQRNLPDLSLQDLELVPWGEYQWIHFEGRNVKTLLSCLEEVKAADVACPVSLELEKSRADIEQLLPFVDNVIVSSAYLQSKNIQAEQCLHMLSQYNPDLNIVCTLGSSGLLAKDHSGKIIKLDAGPVEQVIDTIGAGDCFIAGLIHHMVKNNDFESALVYANKLAAKKIQFKGMKIND